MAKEDLEQKIKELEQENEKLKAKQKQQSLDSIRKFIPKQDSQRSIIFNVLIDSFPREILIDEAFCKEHGINSLKSCKWYKTDCYQILALCHEKGLLNIEV